MAIIDIKNLSFKHNEANSLVLKDINIRINSGEFILLAGESGCGKTTLLRLLKKELNPSGETIGEIYYNDTLIKDLNPLTSASEIGFVMQNPNNQIITDRVASELAFGLESLAYESMGIRRKIAEISSYFGINDLYNKRTDELSGGEKQLINLASIMLMNPKVLILDEPTSQLDPVAANNFLSILKKLNNEFGITIILVEQRLEEVFVMVDRVILMKEGKIYLDEAVDRVGESLKEKSLVKDFYHMLPSSLQLYLELEGVGGSPLSVRDARKYIEENFSNGIKELKKKKEVNKNRQKAIEIKDGYFRYGRNFSDVIKNLSLDVYENEFLVILGSNGVGKTTLLDVIAGVRRLYSGKIKLYNKNIKTYKETLYHNLLAYLPQNPELLFVKSSLIDDLKEVTTLLELSSKDALIEIDKVVVQLGIKHLLNRHPYDLSGGEIQKAGLAKLLLLKPKLLLLDEATKGLDANSKIVLAGIINELKKDGITIVMVSHDVEFAARYADRACMYFDGRITAISNVDTFFSENLFYTTSSSRISRGYYEGIVTTSNLIELCKQNMRKNYEQN